jgi:hypothetical protein
MKKIIAIVAMGAILAMGNVMAYADTYDELTTRSIEIKVDGKEISSYDAEQDVDLPAVIVNGRTMMPLKRTFELFGVETSWNGEERSITANTPNGTLWLQIDNATAKLNGVDVQLDAAPTIFESRTFVPLAFISQSMGVEPLWNGADRSVTLNIADLTKQRLPESYLNEYLLTYEELEDADYYYSLVNPEKSMVYVNVDGTIQEALTDASEELHIETTDFLSSDEVGGLLYSFQDYDQNENHHVIRTIGSNVYVMKFKMFNIDEVIQVIKDFNGGRI